jgi:hypothetical protein
VQTSNKGFIESYGGFWSVGLMKSAHSGRVFDKKWNKTATGVDRLSALVVQQEVARDAKAPRGEQPGDRMYVIRGIVGQEARLCIATLRTAQLIHRATHCSATRAGGAHKALIALS